MKDVYKAKRLIAMVRSTMRPALMAGNGRRMTTRALALHGGMLPNVLAVNRRVNANAAMR